MRSLSPRLGPVFGAAALLGIGYFLGQIQSDPLAAQPASKGVVPAAGVAPERHPTAGSSPTSSAARR